MRQWALLTAAILTEVSGTLALRAGLTQPAWYLLTVAGYVAATLLLAAMLRAGGNLGVLYGVWGASGVALTAVLSMLLFREPLLPLMIVGIALIIVGVLVVEIGAQRAADRRRQP